MDEQLADFAKNLFGIEKDSHKESTRAKTGLFVDSGESHAVNSVGGGVREMFAAF